MRTPWWPRRWWLRIRPAMRHRTNCAPPCSAPPQRPTIQGPHGCWRCSAQPAWRPTARPSSPCAQPIGKRNPWPPFRPSQWGASPFRADTKRLLAGASRSPSTPAPHSAPATTRRRKAACSRSTGWLAAGGCAVHSTSAQAPESSPWQPRASGRHRCSHSIATPWRWLPRARRCGRTRSTAGCRWFKARASACVAVSGSDTPI